jgi:hypothetical protein
MRKTYVLIFSMVSFVSCSQQETADIPRIDQSLIESDDLLWDLDLLQETPAYEYLDSTSTVREILFKGPDHQGQPTRVYACYSNPDILKTGKNRGNMFPGVVLISGGSQPAFPEWVERWAHEGYAAITCDYGNNRKLPDGGPTSSLEYIYDSIQNGAKSVRAYRTAAISILAHSLLLSFPEVEKNKTAVTGISWGGFQTCIVSGIDNRFKAAAPVYGCAFHDEIIFKKYLYENMDKTGRELWMRKIDPKNYLVFSQCPTLFINGNRDGCFDIIPFDKTTKLIPEKNRHISIKPNMGHDHPIGWRPREIAVFFNSIFKEGIPLARITGIEEQDTLISFSYESTLTLKKARFYFSSDTLHINENRTWESIPARIYKDRVESPCPEKGFVMGFLYIRDAMDLGVSSELLVH